MVKWSALITALVVAAVAGSGAQTPTPRPQPGAAPVTAPEAQQYEAVVARYCVTCHNQRTKTAGLALDTMDLTAVERDADVWEGVLRKVRGRMMPPPGLPQPEPPVRTGFVSWLEGALDRAATARPNPGRPLAHRLNRSEYANAIRDLLGVEVDVAPLLPADDSSFGFDNVADVLGVSPVLLESYLAAAGKISALAIGDVETPATSLVYRVRQDASQNRHVEGLPLGTVGGVIVHPTLPSDGEYVLQARLFRTNLGTMRGLEYPQQLEFTVDGARVHLAAFGGNAEIIASSDNPTTTGNDVDARLQVRVKLRAGQRAVTAAFIEKTAVQNTRRLQPFVRSSSDTIDFAGYPHIDTFTITGPFSPVGVSETESRRRIFVCRPATSADEAACARRILSTLARRAYRGDLTDRDVDRLMASYATGRRKGSFDAGIELALRRILASPKFAFRVERDPANARPGTVYRISDLELASRLSFFLWSSIPDDELLQVASQNRLGRPAVLEQQVRRMLADPKAGALIGNFAAQWLHLRNLKNKVPNSNEFPDFDDNLRRSLLRETELLVQSVMQEDRNVLDLMRADYTFVNERLAKHYGIPNIYGAHFRRVPVAHDARRGLLGHGSILMVTSHADRTSPVLRGKWVLENVLGTPPPPPPDSVPPFPENTEVLRPRSVRERTEQHRANPACASCHRLMDPVGFALENFDAVGAWRERDGGTLGSAVDASGQLADGTAVNGPVALREALLREPQTFVRTMTEKLMIYALGRGLAQYDRAAVRTIVRDAGRHDYRFSSLVLGIANSASFQMRISGSEDEDPARIAAGSP